MKIIGRPPELRKPTVEVVESGHVLKEPNGLDEPTVPRRL